MKYINTKNVILFLFFSLTNHHAYTSQGANTTYNLQKYGYITCKFQNEERSYKRDILKQSTFFEKYFEENPNTSSIEIKDIPHNDFHIIYIALTNINEKKNHVFFLHINIATIMI